MFKSIATKTLYQKRWMIFFWSLAIIAMTVLTLSFYPSFAQSRALDDLTKNLPKSLQGLIGNAALLKTIPGYIGQQIFALRMPLLTLILSITLFIGLTAGDEAEGTLQTLLAQPVSRTRVLLQKLIAGAIILAIASLAIIIGVFIGLAVINESFSVLRLVQATFGCWLISMVFGTLALLVGSATGKKGVASGVASGAAFTSYLITSLAPSVSKLQPLQKFSPFRYYLEPSIAERGLVGTNVLVLVETIVIMIILALILFNRRDIYQH